MTTNTHQPAVVPLQAVAHPATIQHPSIDAIVDNITTYARICEAQSVIFREHVEETTREFALFAQSRDVARPGQRWMPAPGDERDAFVREMERRCGMVPRTIAE
jgi:hypothetical protein